MKKKYIIPAIQKIQLDPHTCCAGQTPASGPGSPGGAAAKGLVDTDDGASTLDDIDTGNTDVTVDDMWTLGW